MTNPFFKSQKDLLISNILKFNSISFLKIRGLLSSCLIQDLGPTFLYGRNTYADYIYLNVSRYLKSFLFRAYSFYQQSLKYQTHSTTSKLKCSGKTFGFGYFFKFLISLKFNTQNSFQTNIIESTCKTFAFRYFFFFIISITTLPVLYQ